MDKQHSILPPSSAARRMACPGSRALEALYPPEEPSKSAREGDAAHEVAVKKLSYTDIQVGNLTSNGEMITQEMIDGAEIYYDAIHAITDVPGEIVDFILHLEKRIDISNIHPQCWGTPDAWLFQHNQIHVWDYKFGHSPVEVFENWQLLEYAAGIFLDVSITRGEIVDKICLHIVQPRAYHKDGAVRSWGITRDEMLKYIRRLADSEFAAMQLDAPTRVSSECKNCKARHACPALQQAALSTVDVAADNSPVLLSASAVGRELRLLRHAKKLLDARVTGIEEQAISYIRSGANVPFFNLESGRSSRVWKVPASSLATLQELIDIPLLKTEAAITPTQAKAAGVPEDILNEYSEVRPGAMKLAEDNGNNARKIFGGGK